MNGRPWWEKYHAPILLIVGLVGIAYETVVQNSDRPYLLALFGGMVGLPFIIRADQLLGRGAPPPPITPPSPPPSVPP